MPRRVALYLDTSVPNAVGREPASRATLTARFLLDAPRRYDLIISDLVLAEVEATPDEGRRSELLALLRGFAVIATTRAAEELAAEYRRVLAIPEADALHVALATVEGVDYVASWNLKHIAREKTRRVVDRVNVARALHRPYLITPAQFLQTEPQRDL